MTKYKYFLLFFSFISIFISEVLHAKSISLKQALKLPAEERLELVQLVKDPFVSNSTECPKALSSDYDMKEATEGGIGEDIIAFMMTLRQNDPEMFDLLLKAIKEANLNVQGENKDTLLNIAIQRGHTEIVIVLIEAGSNLNVRNSQSNRPLHLAVRQDRTEVVVALIKAGANINARNGRYETPLHIAVRQDHTEVVVALIKAGANINARNGKYDTPLDFAMRTRNTESAIALVHAVLIKVGADVDNSLLHIAVQHNNMEMIRALIAVGVDPNSHYHSYRLNHSFYPLDLAIRNGHIEAVIALIKAGANVNAKNKNNKTPLDKVISGFPRIGIVEKNSMETAIVLIKAGAYISAQDKDGLLQEAVKLNHIEAVKFLVAAGANVNARDIFRGCPLDR